MRTLRFAVVAATVLVVCCNDNVMIQDPGVIRVMRDFGIQPAIDRVRTQSVRTDFPLQGVNTSGEGWDKECGCSDLELLGKAILLFERRIDGFGKEGIRTPGYKELAREMHKMDYPDNNQYYSEAQKDAYYKQTVEAIAEGDAAPDVRAAINGQKTVAFESLGNSLTADQAPNQQRLCSPANTTLENLHEEGLKSFCRAFGTSLIVHEQHHYNTCLMTGYRGDQSRTYEQTALDEIGAYSDQIAYLQREFSRLRTKCGRGYRFDRLVVHTLQTNYESSNARGKYADTYVFENGLVCPGEGGRWSMIGDSSHAYWVETVFFLPPEWNGTKWHSPKHRVSKRVSETDDPSGLSPGANLVMLENESPPRIELVGYPVPGTADFESDGPAIAALTPTDECSRFADDEAAIPMPNLAELGILDEHTRGTPGFGFAYPPAVPPE